MQSAFLTTPPEDKEIEVRPSFNAPAAVDRCSRLQPVGALISTNIPAPPDNTPRVNSIPLRNDTTTKAPLAHALAAPRPASTIMLNPSQSAKPSSPPAQILSSGLRKKLKASEVEAAKRATIEAARIAEIAARKPATHSMEPEEPVPPKEERFVPAATVSMAPTPLVATTPQVHNLPQAELGRGVPLGHGCQAVMSAAAVSVQPAAMQVFAPAAVPLTKNPALIAPAPRPAAPTSPIPQNNRPVPTMTNISSTAAPIARQAPPHSMVASASMSIPKLAVPEKLVSAPLPYDAGPVRSLVSRNAERAAPHATMTAIVTPVVFAAAPVASAHLRTQQGGRLVTESAPAPIMQTESGFKAEISAPVPIMTMTSEIVPSVPNSALESVEPEMLNVDNSPNDPKAA